jgi:hypothetical protein
MLVLIVIAIAIAISIIIFYKFRLLTHYIYILPRDFTSDYYYKYWCRRLHHDNKCYKCNSIGEYYWIVFVDGKKQNICYNCVKMMLDNVNNCHKVPRYARGIFRIFYNNNDKSSKYFCVKKNLFTSKSCGCDGFSKCPELPNN